MNTQSIESASRTSFAPHRSPHLPEGSRMTVTSTAT